MLCAMHPATSDHPHSSHRRHHLVLTPSPHPAPPAEPGHAHVNIEREPDNTLYRNRRGASRIVQAQGSAADVQMVQRQIASEWHEPRARWLDRRGRSLPTAALSTHSQVTEQVGIYTPRS